MQNVAAPSRPPAAPMPMNRFGFHMLRTRGHKRLLNEKLAPRENFRICRNLYHVKVVAKKNAEDLSGQRAKLHKINYN